MRRELVFYFPHIKLARHFKRLYLNYGPLFVRSQEKGAYVKMDQMIYSNNICSSENFKYNTNPEVDYELDKEIIDVEEAELMEGTPSTSAKSQQMLNQLNEFNKNTPSPMDVDTPTVRYESDKEEDEEGGGTEKKKKKPIPAVFLPHTLMIPLHNTLNISLSKSPSVIIRSKFKYYLNVPAMNDKDIDKVGINIISGSPVSMNSIDIFGNNILSSINFDKHSENIIGPKCVDKRAIANTELVFTKKTKLQDKHAESIASINSFTSFEFEYTVLTDNNRDFQINNGGVTFVSNPVHSTPNIPQPPPPEPDENPPNDTFNRPNNNNNNNNDTNNPQPDNNPRPNNDTNNPQPPQPKNNKPEDEEIRKETAILNQLKHSVSINEPEKFATDLNNVLASIENKIGNTQNENLLNIYNKQKETVQKHLNQLKSEKELQEQIKKSLERIKNSEPENIENIQKELEDQFNRNQEILKKSLEQKPIESMVSAANQVQKDVKDLKQLGEKLKETLQSLPQNQEAKEGMKALEMLQAELDNSLQTENFNTLNSDPYAKLKSKFDKLHVDLIGKLNIPVGASPIKTGTELTEEQSRIQNIRNKLEELRKAQVLANNKVTRDKTSKISTITEELKKLAGEDLVPLENMPIEFEPINMNTADIATKLFTANMALDKKEELAKIFETIPKDTRNNDKYKKIYKFPIELSTDISNLKLFLKGNLPENFDFNNYANSLLYMAKSKLEYDYFKLQDDSVTNINFPLVRDYYSDKYDDIMYTSYKFKYNENNIEMREFETNKPIQLNIQENSLAKLLIDNTKQPILFNYPIVYYTKTGINFSVDVINHFCKNNDNLVKWINYITTNNFNTNIEEYKNKNIRDALLSIFEKNYTDEEFKNKFKNTPYIFFYYCNQAIRYNLVQHISPEAVMNAGIIKNTGNEQLNAVIANANNIAALVFKYPVNPIFSSFIVFDNFDSADFSNFDNYQLIKQFSLITAGNPRGEIQFGQGHVNVVAIGGYRYILYYTSNKNNEYNFHVYGSNIQQITDKTIYPLVEPINVLPISINTNNKRFVLDFIGPIGLNIKNPFGPGSSVFGKNYNKILHNNNIQDKINEEDMLYYDKAL
ncbi:hypothetical protein SGHV010 [Glossina pallidipes salivary gland hypertrophy virus]|uniref:Uncharacterized protein n=1 Tax=Glossina hytrovirus (isolate Glossina pallidipes/Ethiopia/Seibersdorf/-) TaxID=379529 RepID=B0YLG4_GHVS|nr:hypothetical protein SGHV010 [Glossina pallidipes salivary gland hypertrophy virus]ABQ08783.1 hypothetical protein SGHV010 [Glossina pallidipes salivary gland hypertrophy virus]